MFEQRHNTKATKTIAFVLYPGFTVLDLAGPWEILSALGEPYRTVTVAEKMDAVESDTQLKMLPQYTFEQIPNPDAIVIPGGDLGPFKAMVNNKITTYLHQVVETAEIVASVCSGSLILAAMELLKGRRATTHWAAAEVLEKLGAQYVRERWVEDGKFFTAAGVSAGIDLALELAARMTSQANARRIQVAAEYNPQPPQWGVDWSQLDSEQLKEYATQNGYNSLKMTLAIAKTLASRPALLAKLALN
jgi:transcriptional regulator GlxA family with amidase domain